jgi:hypothetical protein
VPANMTALNTYSAALAFVMASSARSGIRPERPIKPHVLPGVPAEGFGSELGTSLECAAERPAGPQVAWSETRGARF